MDVAEALDTLRQDADGCDLVAFADLASGMVLRVSSARRHPQEELDVLPGLALSVFGSPIAEGAAALLDGANPGTAITVTSVDARLYMRAPSPATEALICVCAPGSDLAQVLDCSKTALGRIVALG